ncbi:MAG: hypothetical protein Q7S74_04055 [Nanoarchaeota archaeon]|nr:hypothetical protein [Nanoarchaeota archaeon]
MDDFTAKKIGEVLAIARIGQETLEKGRESFDKIFGINFIDKYISENSLHARALEDTADAYPEVKEVILNTAETTTKKLNEMRDLYINNNWNNPESLVEWLSFLEGAAIVRWYLVQGATEKAVVKRVALFSSSVIEFHEKFLMKIAFKLKETAPPSKESVITN